MNTNNELHYIRIKNGKIFLDGKQFFSAEKNVSSFLRSAYTFLEMDYPKFYKMDDLSKLGVIATAFLQQKANLSENTALVFSNTASSLESDKNYESSIQNFPSPSIFVYTLPNIVLGEISIRFGLKSENVFFIDNSFNPGLLQDYASQLLLTNKADKVLCGWLNLHNAEYDVFLWLISEENIKKASLKTISKIYHANYD